MVSAQAILTQLVFDHALRIRMKAETSDPQSGSDASTAVATPDSASVADAQPDDETVRDDNDSANSKFPKKGKQAADASIPKPVTNARPIAIEKRKADKGGNLVGKINNLVTSDLQNLISGVDFLVLGKYQMQYGHTDNC